MKLYSLTTYDMNMEHFDEAIWHACGMFSFGVVAIDANPTEMSERELTTASLEQIANKATLVFLEAFDGEGYMVCTFTQTQMTDSSRSSD